MGLTAAELLVSTELKEDGSFASQKNGVAIASGSLAYVARRAVCDGEAKTTHRKSNKNLSIKLTIFKFINEEIWLKVSQRWDSF